MDTKTISWIVLALLTYLLFFKPVRPNKNSRTNAWIVFLFWVASIAYILYS